MSLIKSPSRYTWETSRFHMNKRQFKDSLSMPSKLRKELMSARFFLLPRSKDSDANITEISLE